MAYVYAQLCSMCYYSSTVHDWAVLLELHALTLAASSYALLVIYVVENVDRQGYV